MTQSRPEPGFAPRHPLPRPAPSSPPAGEAAIELLERQLAIYQELGALARRQPALIEADDTDALLSLLAQRELTLDHLIAVSDELAPLRARWDDLTEAMTDLQRQRCREAIDGIARAAEALAARDAADRTALERRRADVASELAGLKAGRGALAAYGPERAAGAGALSGLGGARFQDREA